MSLKNSAFLALVGMLLLSVMLTLGFIQQLMALLQGVTPFNDALKACIALLASLGVTVFFFVFHRAQS